MKPKPIHFICTECGIERMVSSMKVALDHLKFHKPDEKFGKRK